MYHRVFVPVLMACLVVCGNLAAEPPSATTDLQTPTPTVVSTPLEEPVYTNCTRDLLVPDVCIEAGGRGSRDRRLWNTTTEVGRFLFTEGKYTHITTLSVPVGYVINYIYVRNLFEPPVGLVTMIDGGPAQPYVTLSMESDYYGLLGFQSEIYVVKLTPDKIK